MSSAAKRRSGILHRACIVKFEALERRVMLDAALPNPPVPAPPLPPGNLPLQGVVGTPISWSPQMMQERYGMNQLFYDSNNTITAADGTGQTIAIVDAFGSPTIVSDVQTFDAQWGLSNGDSSGNFFLTVQALAPGANTITDTVADQIGWGEETSLDVEWAHVMAPKAHILLVEAPSDGLLDLMDSEFYACEQPQVAVVSNSWGLPLNDPDFQGEQLRFDGFISAPAGHQGEVVLFASGDTGVLDYPAASDNVIAVGGSTNNVTINGDLTSIGAWNSEGGSSGGGSDTLYTNPHQVPLLSMDADPLTGVWVFDSQPGGTDGAFPPIGTTPAGWSVVGGTSLSCPLFAGYMSTIQEGLTLTGQATLDTATAYDELLVAGEADPYYFTIGNTPGLGGYPLWGTGPNVAIPSLTAIPNNGNRGFGDPIFTDVTVSDSTLSNNGVSGGDELQQGLTALLVGGNETVEEYDGINPAPTPPPLTFSSQFAYLEQNPSVVIQHLGPNNQKGTPLGNWFFAAPAQNLVIDSSDATFADSLSFESEPQNAIAGQSVGGIIVDVDSPGGGIDAGYNGAVTLTLTSGVNVLGVTTVLAVDGRTVIPNTNTSAFSDIIIDQESGNLVFEATAEGAIPAYSTPFNVNPAAASQLVIISQPTSDFQYATLPAVIVDVDDVFGNFVVSDYSPVTLSLDSGPGPISGTATLRGLGGIATFSNLSFTVPGVYSLTVSDPTDGLVPLTTMSFTITAFPIQRGATFNGAGLSTPLTTLQQKRNAGVYSNDGLAGLGQSFDVHAQTDQNVDAIAATVMIPDGPFAAGPSGLSHDDLPILNTIANLRNEEILAGLTP